MENDKTADMNRDNPVNKYFLDEPTFLYDLLLRGTLTEVYTAYKKTSKEGVMKYATLLIDKFAIQSATLFHLFNGIIEHRKSGETVRLNGFDLFTVNTTLRAVMETYATFHNIFVESTSDNERQFRFLLWKIDGLTEKGRFFIREDDFKGAKEILERDKEILAGTRSELESCVFYKSLDRKERAKVYNPAKEKYRWRFVLKEGEIVPLNISSLIDRVFRMRAFVNTYRHSSIHTHSNYNSIEEFERVRGKLLPENENIDPLVRLAVIMTAMLIYDICSTDENAGRVIVPVPLADFIRGMTLTTRMAEGE